MLAIYKCTAFDVYYVLNAVALLIFSAVMLLSNIFGKVNALSWVLAEVLEENISHWLVRFYRQINGLPVANSGGNTLAVRIGDRGEIASVFKLWREVVPYKELELVSPQRAYQELLSGMGKHYIPSDCEKVIIEQVNLAYWMESMNQQHDYVVPVYEFKGKCLDKNGNIMEGYTGWTEAIK